MIANLGLRIERLLYSGFFLIIISISQIYFSETAAYFSNPTNSSIDIIINTIDKNKTELSKIFDSEKMENKPSTERDLAANTIRRKLGLPPVKSQNIINKKREESYHEKLSKIFHQNSLLNYDEKIIADVMDDRKSLMQLLNELKAIRAQNEKKSAEILGIEIPRLLSFQYGSADFKIPSKLIAIILFLIIQPLSLIWLGSFYLTRQRELILMRKIDNTSIVFPHILNWLTIDFSHSQSNIINIKNRTKILRVAAFFTTSFRCLIVTVIAFLIILPSIYSAAILKTALSINIALSIICFIFLLINIILFTMLFSQELEVMKGKVYYE
ncbi:hypothetical protein [Chromobacterium violaceum]|uniref:ABC transporter permease n=1 Tax=Chromobacterium violaceum TaxID=536 RepID=A0AAX2MFX4_CHRVL|nr:hypothetical protein [Chromobacterium violaceum]STB69482.1 Uncharacterised protein [Chromobacterium violaceum]SUY93253.1 Uncharacterised protein [Chromobacterium violaceum]